MPPPPISWNEYERHINLTWKRLLNSDQQDDESAFQRFFEKHPSLLPDCYQCFSRGASPQRCLYYSQPELPGFRAKRPDFMTIVFDSDAVIAMLIEIEAPGKPWTTKTGGPSAKLTQGLDQLRDWKSWFREPENILQFRKLYEIDERLLETHQFEQRYVLVYGRRAEAQSNPEFSKKRRLLGAPDEILMTYDRLRPSDRMRDAPTVRLNRATPTSRLSALQVPPTLRLGPHNAEQLSKLAGLREAIMANELISDARKGFLAKRLAYWESWARQPLAMPAGGFEPHYDYAE